MNPFSVLPYFDCPICGEVYNPKLCSHTKLRHAPRLFNRYNQWLRGGVKKLSTYELLRFLWLKQNATFFSAEFLNDGFSEWPGGTEQGVGDVIVDSEATVVKSGAFSARATTNDASGYARCRASLAAKSTVWCRWYSRTNSLVSGASGFWEGYRLRTYDGATYNIIDTLFDKLTNVYYLRLDRDVPSATTTRFAWSWAVDTWYCMELKFVGSATVGEYRVFVDGVEKITQTGLNTGTQKSNYHWAGTVSSSGMPAAGFISYLDAVILDDASQVGCISAAANPILQMLKYPQPIG